MDEGGAVPLSTSARILEIRATMQIRRHRDYRRMAWKNGGGETAEIAIFPEGATLDTFDWRVSMATVAADGPFSAFPGVDRTLAILQGAGLTLLPDSRGPILVEAAGQPVVFPSEVPITARLVDGPVTDFNVMTRRGRFRHHVSRMTLTEPAVLKRHGATMLVLLVDGTAEVGVAAGRSRADVGDTILVDAPEEADVTVVPLSPLTLYVVDLWPA